MKIKKPKSFTIDRAKWVNGSHRVSTRGVSMLLNCRGYRCCLGFYAQACGVMDEALINRAGPNCLLPKIKLPGLVGTDAARSRTSRLFRANDGISDNATREATIRAEFKKIGVRVIFRGGTKP